MRNFCHPGKFRTLTINFSEVWPRQILLQIQSLDYVLETFWKRLKDILKTCYQEQINSMIRLEKVLKTSLQDVLKMSWRRLQNVLKTSWRCLEDVFARRFEDVLKMPSKRLSKMSWRRLENVLKTSSKCLEDVLKSSWQDVLKTSWKRLEQVLKTYDQDEYIGLNQDVLKTSWRRLLKTYE